MWTLQKDFRFEAAHKLPHHDGKCARLGEVDPVFQTSS